MIGNLLGEIATGLTSFLPTIASALFETFVKLFFVTAADGGAVTELNVLGEMSIVFLIISLAWKFLPVVCGWLKTKVKAYREGRKNRKAS